jgi:orotate phosphoribosyltransferase
VYVDNRKFPFFPKEWSLIIDGFRELIRVHQLHFDVIAGIETAGIPHSAALGYSLQYPSVFVRKQAKDHGTRKRVEGGNIGGKRVLLLEDHISTGGSSLSGVEALRAEGAQVTDCLAITSYEFADAARAFAAAQVKLHTLVTFPTILSVAQEQERFTASQYEVIQDWFADPKGWAGRHSFGSAR